MTSPNEHGEEILRALLAGAAEPQSVPEEEIRDAVAAYERLEALFDLLRRPATSLASRAEDCLKPGQKLGEFTILQPLAAGGMGQVYLARQELLGRLVALKVCKPEFARDARTRSRFTAEGQALAQLTHPNVVPVLSTGEDQGYLYLAMEYVAGPTLAQALEAVRGSGTDSLASTVVARVLAPSGGGDGPLHGDGHAKLDRAYQAWAVQTLRQVAQGLAAAHAAGTLHRDIKPANIVFASDGNPKIVDFGLARIARGPSTTVVGEFYGTPAYTSPEQARGELEAVGPWSDVFSFGAMLFECLSLARPFEGRTSADVLSAVLNSEAPLLRRLERRIPPELEAITDKCLRKNPLERYQSAEGLADDLRNYLELQPVSAKPPGAIGRVSRAIRRRPWVAAFVVTLAVAFVLAVFAAGNAWKAYKAGMVKTFGIRVDQGNVALFRCLTGQRPTWLRSVIDSYRQQGITAYTAALTIEPRAVWPLVQRGRLYASKTETAPLALADLDKAQTLQPGYRSIREFRGIVLADLGRDADALNARAEAQKLYPTAPEDLYWLGVIAYSKEQDYGKAYQHFSQALLLAPNDYWSRLERAEYGRKAAETEQAKIQRITAELDVAKTIRPDLPFASEVLAWFKSIDDPKEGEKEWSAQIEHFGLDILRAHAISDCLQRQNRHEEAESILRRVLADDTGGVTAERIGDVEYRLKRFTEAQDWYQRSISQGTRDPFVYMRLALACTAVKDWRRAENAYLEGISELPKEAFLYWGLGACYEARGRMTDAERTYRKGCELPDEVVGSPRPSQQGTNLASCYEHLASLLARTGRPTDAIHELERGIARLEKTPADVNLLKQHLGSAYVSNGRRQDALALLGIEAKKQPLTLERARMLVNAWNYLGDRQAALEVGRLAEFTLQERKSDTLWAVRDLLDTQLRSMGLFKELRARLEATLPATPRWCG